MYEAVGYFGLCVVLYCVDERGPGILPFSVVVKFSIVLYIGLEHSDLLAVSERKPVIRRETMAACLEVLDSIVGWVRYLLCVCTCIRPPYD